MLNQMFKYSAVALAAMAVSCSDNLVGPRPVDPQELASAIPAVPIDLHITVISPSAVLLTWIDNAYNETGYRVERSDSESGEFITLADLDSDACAFCDTGLLGHSTYCYRVRALRNNHASTHSETLCVTVSLVRPPRPSATCTAFTANPKLR